mgnify:CR=1 FL=1
MLRYKRLICQALFITCCMIAWTLPAAAEDAVLMMATTTSTDNTGLLDYLAPHFKKATGIDLRWTATGTGKALKLGENCDVDVLMVHAPAAEKKFVADGFGDNRREIMYNDFVIIGPAGDPAGAQSHQQPRSGLSRRRGRRLAARTLQRLGRDGRARWKCRLHDPVRVGPVRSGGCRESIWPAARSCHRAGDADLCRR